MTYFNYGIFFFQKQIEELYHYALMLGHYYELKPL